MKLDERRVHEVVREQKGAKSRVLRGRAARVRHEGGAVREQWGCMHNERWKPLAEAGQERVGGREQAGEGLVVPLRHR